MPQQFPGIGEDVSHLMGGGSSVPAIGEDVSHLMGGDAPARSASEVLYDPARRPVSAEDFAPKPSKGWPATIGDVLVGGIKGLGSTVAGIAETAVNAGVVPGQTPAAFNPAFRNPLFQKTDDLTTASNTAQRVGKVAEQAAELLIPTGVAGKAAIEALPSTARAGSKFQEVMSAARNIPIDITEPGNVGLRIQQLAERGGTMPRAVTQLLRRMTDPDKAPMAYEEARDFASNISRLSADEFGRLTPAIAREVSGLRVALNRSVADAAGAAGKGVEYAQAMKEYAQAKKLHDAVTTFTDGAKKALPYIGGAGAGYWLTKHITSLLPGGE